MSSPWEQSQKQSPPLGMNSFVLKWTRFRGSSSLQSSHHSTGHHHGSRNCDLLPPPPHLNPEQHTSHLHPALFPLLPPSRQEDSLHLSWHPHLLHPHSCCLCRGKMQCKVEVQGLACPRTKFMVIFWRWLTLSSWCQILAEIYRFPYMSDSHRQHLINSGENDNWMQKMPYFGRNF